MRPLIFKRKACDGPFAPPQALCMSCRTFLSKAPRLRSFLEELFPITDSVAQNQSKEEHGVVEGGDDLIMIQHHYRQDGAASFAIPAHTGARTLPTLLRTVRQEVDYGGTDAKEATGYKDRCIVRRRGRTDRVKEPPAGQGHKDHGGHWRKGAVPGQRGQGRNRQQYAGKKQR